MKVDIKNQKILEKKDLTKGLTLFSSHPECYFPLTPRLQHLFMAGEDYKMYEMAP